ncbi:transporter [Synergistales bacterium]|nr:transporter [Synergistales bacterium]
MNEILVVLPIFLLIALGLVLKRKKLLSDQTMKEDNFILYWIAMPANLLHGILGTDSNSLKDFTFVFATWLPYLIVIILVWLVGRYKETHERFSVLSLSAVRGNHFFAGIPVVALAMGQSGVERATLILAFSLVIMQLISIGSGQLAMFGSLSLKTVKATCAQLLKNPLFVSCFIGLFMVSLDINHLPKWLDATMTILANISTGLALIVLGAQLHLENIVKMVVSVWKIIFFKLLCMPIVTWIVYVSFGIEMEYIQAGVLLAAMPVGVNTSIIASEMKMDAEYCARGVAFTTLISILSLPIWIKVLGIVQ